MLPAAISFATWALCRRAYSLNESTSSELEIVSGGTKIPVPLMAIFVTTHTLSGFPGAGCRSRAANATPRRRGRVVPCTDQLTRRRPHPGSHPPGFRARPLA
jgi:hypothetical protein